MVRHPSPIVMPYATNQSVIGNAPNLSVKNLNANLYVKTQAVSPNKRQNHVANAPKDKWVSRHNTFLKNPRLTPAVVVVMIADDLLLF